MTDFTNRENSEEQRLSMLSQDHLRLRRQFNWLIGLLIGMLLLIGGLSAIAVRLMSDKNQLEQQVGALTSDKAEFAQVKTLDTRVNTLEQQVKSLNQQVPKGLPTALKTNQAQFQSLQTTVSNLNTKVATLEQINAALQSQLKQQPATQLPTPAKSP